MAHTQRSETRRTSSSRNQRGESPSLPPTSLSLGSGRFQRSGASEGNASTPHSSRRERRHSAVISTGSASHMLPPPRWIQPILTTDTTDTACTILDCPETQPVMDMESAIHSLREAVRAIWTSCTLSEMSAENSKVLLVDSRFSVWTAIRGLIEYKKSSLFILSEETGTIIGGFGALDIADYLLHSWYLLTDDIYSEKLSSVLSLFAPPGIEFETFPTRKFSSHMSTETVQPGHHGTGLEDSNTTNEEEPWAEAHSGSYASVDIGIHVDSRRSVALKLAAAAALRSTQVMLLFPGAQGLGFRHSLVRSHEPSLIRDNVDSAVPPKKKLVGRALQSHKADRVAAFAMGEVPHPFIFVSDEQARSDHQLGLTASEQEQLLLAALVGQYHQTLIQGLPDWFSVRLLKSPAMTRENMQRILISLSEGFSKVAEAAAAGHYCSGTPLSAYGACVDVEPVVYTGVNVGSASGVSGTGSSDPAVLASETLPPASHATTSESKMRPFRHRFWLPPPWMYTLDFWRRIAGPTGTACFLSISPERPSLEAIVLLLQKKLSEVIVWNDDRQCPLHCLTTSWFLHHLVQHVGHIIRLGLGSTADDVIVVYPTSPMSEVLEVLTCHGFTSIPVVAEPLGDVTSAVRREKRFLGFFSRTHLLALIEKVAQHRGHIPAFLSTGADQPRKVPPEYAYCRTNVRERIKPSVELFPDSRQNEGHRGPFLRSEFENTAKRLDLGRSLNETMQYFFNFSYYTEKLPIHFYYARGEPSIKAKTTPVTVSDCMYSHQVDPRDHPPKGRDECGGAKGGMVANPLIEKQSENHGDSYELHGSLMLDHIGVRAKASDGYQRLPLNVYPPKGDLFPISQRRHGAQEGKTQSPSSRHVPVSDTHLKTANETGFDPCAILLMSHGIAPQETIPSLSNMALASTAVGDEDITLRDIITHILLTPERRVVLVDPVSTEIRRLITATDVLRFLLGLDD